LLLALAAYGLWGVFPLYFKLLQAAGALEILGHRVVWTLITLAAILLILRRGRRSIPILLGNRRQSLPLIAAAALIAVNWGTYVYGVNTDRVVETSLGYFLTPLVSVALGVAVLRERMRPVQWAAVGAGTVAGVVLTVDYGRPPWIAFVLAGSFGLYGLVKKAVNAPPLEGLAVESGVLVLPALAYLGWLTAQDRSTFGSVSTEHTLLLVSLGVITAIPLLCFAGAANRVALSTLGIAQYLAPVGQFAIGVLVFAEPMPPARLAGFALVWLALLAFTVDGVHHHRRQLGRAAESVAT